MEYFRRFVPPRSSSNFLSVLCLEAASRGENCYHQKENTFCIEGYSDYIKHGDRA